MDRPLRIAHCVEGYAPAGGGMAEVVRQLSERMARQGHQVTVLTSAHAQRPDGVMQGVRVRGFEVRGNARVGITGDVEGYLHALRTGGFDIITFFAAQQWATDAALPHLDGLPGRKVLVPTGFSGLHDPQWSSYYGQMPQWMARMDLHVLHTEGYQDAVFARTHGITRTALIPNGASEEEFEGPIAFDFRKAHGIASQQALIVHIGGFTGIKGQREALEIFIAADTGTAVLALIGHGISVLERAFNSHWRFSWMRLRAKLKGKRILFLDPPREQAVAALRQADAFLFPSRMECSPIVLFEAMAAGVPFLSSEAGNSAEIARWGGSGRIVPCTREANGLITPDLRAGARMLTELLSDASLRARMGASGKAAWKAGFTWRAIAQRYLDAYRELLLQP
ncbi:MAG: glycosyltransferase family 4 protein [Flavobacteriales bacterium]|nr:glycosyltransferase family 4 protein [Flavobacteriales bacterium]